MSTYDVHAYAVVRVKVTGVEAATPEAATEVAEELLTSGPAAPVEELLNTYYAKGGGRMVGECRIEGAEYADELAYFLVDEPGRENEADYEDGVPVPGAYDPAVGTEVAGRLINALTVLVETPGIRAHLEATDPKALAQARLALRGLTAGAVGMEVLAPPASGLER